MSEHEQNGSDRRSMDRRVTLLEQQFATLSTKVDGVGLEQVHSRELIDMRFRTMEKSQEVVSVKLDALSQSIQLMASDAANSPAGRALVKEVGDLKLDHARDLADMKSGYDKLRQKHDELETEIAEARGAVKFATRVGVSALITVILLAVGVAFKLLGAP